MHFAEQVALAKHVVLSAIQANSGRTKRRDPAQLGLFFFA
jgi:hypothetical protein